MNTIDQKQSLEYTLNIIGTKLAFQLTYWENLRNSPATWSRTTGGIRTLPMDVVGWAKWSGKYFT